MIAPVPLAHDAMLADLRACLAERREKTAAVRGSADYGRFDQGFAHAIEVAEGALARFFADQAARFVPDAGAPPTPAAKPATKRASKTAPKLTGAEFYTLLVAAMRAASAELGPRWAFVPGASVLITIPAKIASFKTERGTVIKTRRDQRAPAARFWAGGVLPEGVTFPRPWSLEDRMGGIRRDIYAAYHALDFALGELVSAEKNLEAVYAAVQKNVANGRPGLASDERAVANARGNLANKQTGLCDAEKALWALKDALADLERTALAA
jgi:hypothetical protein